MLISGPARLSGVKMHEVSLVKNMLYVLEMEVNSPEVGYVKTVHLEVGALKYVVPEIIEECFEQAPKHEKLKDARVKIKVIPVKIKCLSCGRENNVEAGAYLCPACSGDNVELAGGDEFMLKGIEW